jgi:transcriptional regulator with XRE-family HTH domain
MSYFKQNIRYIRIHRGLNQEEFGALFKLSRDNIASYERGIEPKLDVLASIGKILHISLDDLVTTDLALGPPVPARAQQAAAREPEAVAEGPAPPGELLAKKEARPLAPQQVPLYNIAAAGGLAGLVNSTGNIMGYLSVPNLPKCDGVAYVTGESMYPLLKSGDMVAFQYTGDLVDGILFGEMYLVSFLIGSQEFTAVKILQPSEQGGDYLKMVSINARYGPKDLSLQSIRSLALVKASISISSMS